MATFYKCPNLGNCDKADKGELIRLPVDSPATCPECNSTLIAAAGRGGGTGIPPWLPIAAIGLLLLLIGVGGWFFFTRDSSVPNCAPPEVLDPATGVCRTLKPNCTPPEMLDPATQNCVTPTKSGDILLRFHGSNTIGGKLLPALASAYLAQEGYGNIRRISGTDPEESFIVGERNNAEKRIEIQSHGSKTAFEDLGNDRCDIGMASRAIKPEEQQALSPMLGDLTSATSEHVLALDGIAVIVHPSNPVKSLTLAQLADIFSGTLSDWSQVGGRAGSITVYARDENSGTWDFFNETVLKKHGKTLASRVQRYEDSAKLSETVGHDPTAIGFIGLNFAGTNKILGLADVSVAPKKPTLLTIKTEDYLLSRRLYLYNAEKPANPEVLKFVEFAVGATAQPVVTSVGLVNLDVTPLTRTETDDARGQSARWKKLTAGAIEIPTRFRFRTNGDELDTRANRDIGRIVYLLSQPAYQNKKVILIGFADTSGSAVINQKLSQSRAEIVKAVLAEEGVEIAVVEGIGAEAFVAPNDTDDNKEKNRRVEVWVK